MPWLLLLLLVCCTNPSLAQGVCRPGQTCRHQLHCSGAFDTFEEMERNTCRLSPGNRGLCCGDVNKREAPPVEIVLRGIRRESLKRPATLSNDIIRNKLGKVEDPGKPQKTDDVETKGHRSFTKPRKKDAAIRNAALKQLRLAEVLLQDEGISLRQSKFGLDSDNSIDVDNNCPWTTDGGDIGRKPRCDQNTRNWRAVDGSCNNVQFPLYGMSTTPQQRILPANYSEGDRPRVATDFTQLPSARLISNTVFQSGDPVNQKQISTLFMQMGQFIDHDLVHSPVTPPNNGCCKKNTDGRPWVFPTREDMQSSDYDSECFPIEIPSDDPFWRNRRTCMEFSRSDPTFSIPKCATTNGREQENAITHWLDGSAIYGSTLEESIQVRGTQDQFAFLKTTKPSDRSARSLLPQCALEVNNNHIEACGDVCEEETPHGTSRMCAFAGDFRVNEQPGLSTMHTIWVREHNRVARYLTNLNKHWDSSRVYQEARRIVIAEFQMIVYNEWLPIVLGHTYMNSFGLFPLKPGQGYTQDYNINVDPRINAEFSGAAFRFGHSLVPNMMKINTNDRNSKEVPLKSVFNDPSELHETGFVEGVVRGQSLETAPNWDPLFSADLMNHLFEENPDEGGLDLVSLNIQRGRDLGLPGYNYYRKICSSGNYERKSTMDQLADDVFLSRSSVEKLKKIYKNIDDIDLFVGGVLEIPYKKSLLGPAFLCILGDQFSRLKVGDRFWFENGGPGNDPATAFSLPRLDSIRNANMARILCDNTDISEVQPLAFRTVDTAQNEVVSCKSNTILEVDLDLWKDIL